MKKEDFCEILGDIDEKYIRQAKARIRIDKISIKQRNGIAVCICLVIIGVSAAFAFKHNGEPINQENITPVQHESNTGNKTEPPETTDFIVVNETDNIMTSDMDVQIFQLQ